ncbi:hypothetical protein [Nitrosopumilus adriaticus]|uniref:Uncharacterized protein n=1 Tax=Nitrosopumilus adriaticus TaxID=1580092 RepID=A0A0D5C2H6_9ARCH|nr:hypothetical protein [Nitrosopumilus adriaticus]AJW70999.1 hypothetical protein NADRNF5_1313 [Nitrosopumilus adriaticus]
MGELPEKYPEYSIMYKTLSNQIKVLNKRKENSSAAEIDEIEQKIQNYKSEISRIKKMFPENFFEEI